MARLEAPIRLESADLARESVEISTVASSMIATIMMRRCFVA